MAEIIEDRVKETTTTTGTGALALAGNMTGFKKFSDVCAVGDTFYCAVVAVNPSGVPTGEWEIGHYTYSAVNTVDRTTVQSSSNGNALVSFSAGTKQVFIEFTAAQIKAINTTGATPNAVMPTVPDTSPYTSIAFQEEFNSSALDTAKWNTAIWYDADNTTKNYSVSAGNLNVWPQKDSTGKYFNRTLDTDGKYYQRYGFFEAEMKLPVGYGFVPAFWLFGHNDTTRPGIDIAKAFPGAEHAGNPGWSTTSDVANTIQMNVADGNGGVQSTLKLSDYIGPQTDLSTQFHKYGVHWSDTQVKFYFDGAQVGSAVDVTNNTALKQRMYILASLWTGGLSGDPNALPAGVAAPSDGDQNNALSINYIRAWRLVGYPVQSDETPPLTSTNPSAPPPSSPPPTSYTVHFYGASGTVGVNGDPSTGPNPVTKPVCVIVAEDTGWTTTKTAISGTDSVEFSSGTNGWTRTVEAEFAAITESTVVVSFVINDWDRDKTTYQNALQRIITAAKNNNKTIVLMGSQTTYQQLSGGTSPGSDDTVGTMNGWMSEVASNNGVGFIDMWHYITNYLSQNGMTNQQFTPDGLHPTQAGYTVMGHYAATRLKEILTPASTTNRMPSGPDQTLFKTTPTFVDDFDGTSLNTGKWATKLWYEGSSPGGNNTANYRVINGNLELCLIDGTFATDGSNQFYRTLTTDPTDLGTGGFAQKYGFFEAEMKLPIGRGMWPGWWLYDHPSYGRPEMDIMEAYNGGGSSWASSDYHPLRADWTLHQGDLNGGSTVLAAGKMVAENGGVDLSAGFHKYGLLWDNDRIELYFDSKKVATVNDSTTLNYFNNVTSMYMLVDLWLGSASGAASTDQSITPTGFNNAMQVNYVYAWQFKKY